MQEVCAKQGLANVRYHKYPGERAAKTQVEGERFPPMCGNAGPIGGLEVKVRLWMLSVCGRWGKYTNSGTSIDEEC